MKTFGTGIASDKTAHNENLSLMRKSQEWKEVISREADFKENIIYHSYQFWRVFNDVCTKTGKTAEEGSADCRRAGEKTYS